MLSKSGSAFFQARALLKYAATGCDQFSILLVQFALLIAGCHIGFI
jgi:hypothetical protein